MKKVCSNCGKELSENAKFCGNCGTKCEEIKEGFVENKYPDNENIKCNDNNLKKHKFKMPKLKRRTWILIIVIIIIFILFNVINKTDGESYVDSDTFKERFCENIGVEYDADEWTETANDVNTDYIAQGYFDGNDLEVIIFINDDNEVVSAYVNSSLIVLDMDEEFLWKCALVSAATGYDMDEADSVVREVNKNGQTTQITDEIAIDPYQEIDTGWATFTVVTKKYYEN